MRSYDFMIIGPATRDVNIDYTGAEDHCIGGAVTFCTPAARAAGAKVFVAVKVHPADADIIDSFHLDAGDIALLPSAKTTLMRNEYFTADRERRRSACAAQSDPISLEEIPKVPCKLYHLAGLLYGDFPGGLIAGLKQRGLVAADIQGFLRHNEGGPMAFHDWDDKLKYLPYLDFLKTDAAEAEILTGLSDREAAARQLHAWGAGEVLISYNTEMLAYDGWQLRRYPVKSRNLTGRTGRGDTVFGAYLAMRMTGADLNSALLYATACVSLKMETPGVFRGTRQDVEDYIRKFYLA